MAAAYAERGDFSAAVQTQNVALKLTSEKDQPFEQDRLRLYLAEKPYREKLAKREK